MDDVPRKKIQENNKEKGKQNLKKRLLSFGLQNQEQTKSYRRMLRATEERAVGLLSVSII